MAKTRMLKTDLRTSEKVASWPIELRYFWVLLWGYVDDHGKGRDNPLLVKADCFPLDPDITGEVIDGWLWSLVEAGVIVRYSLNDTDYVKVIHWSEHQKPQHPTPDVLPNPESAGAVLRRLHAPLMKSSGEVHEERTPELGLSRGELRRGDASSASEPPLFCSIHPRGTTTPCGPCGDARRVYDAWLKTPKGLPQPPAWLPPRKEDYCPRHDWLLKKNCAECAAEKAVAS